MPLFFDTCKDLMCGVGLGLAKGVFGLSLFTAEETEEINNLKKLALSIMEKSPKVVTDRLICEGIKNGDKLSLDLFVKTASPEAVTAGLVAAAELICTKSFKDRFGEVLMGACLNLVGC